SPWPIANLPDCASHLNPPIVSSRKGRLQAMADQGNLGAAEALLLARSPNRFLSTVQIGITLVGILAGAVGSQSLTAILAKILATVPALESRAPQLALIMVITLLTYLYLVVGELVPKRLAMRFPEPLACAMAAPMALLSRLAAPVVAVLSGSTNQLLKAFGIREERPGQMSREELNVLLHEGMVTGSINDVESKMMERVFAFEELEAYDVMVPRTKVVWIERSASHDAVWAEIQQSSQEDFPVYEHDRDNLVGFVSMKDLYGQLAAVKPVTFGQLMQQPLVVPETQKASSLLEIFRQTGQRSAFVLNEFGSVVGMVTLIDLIEMIVGDVPSREERLAPPILQRPDGSWLIDGLFEIEKVAQYLDTFKPPAGAGDDFQTISGWFLHELVRMPTEGDTIATGEWVFEVVDMDLHCVDKVLATKKQ
ncbi:MAG: hemolysin family protein, partial [Verrucomicrobiota bacterium]